MARVAIVMGSDSDLRVMKQATDLLSALGVEYEMVISSAHRAPEKTADYVRTAEARGIQVIIAGAGGAAHLPGVLAAYTTLPVIGVPLKAWATDGLDALLSIAQMPPGVPVATVAINGARNAGILACQILALSDPALKERLAAYKAQLAQGVEAKDRRLQEVGVAQYLEEKGLAR